MTNDPRFERQLPNLLEDLYLGPSPDYRNDVLARVARTRQRPAWTFPGRWLPMVDFVSHPPAIRRVPWRLIAVIAMIALLIAASAAAYIGSRPRLPTPFGPAANGLVAYSQANTVYTADPVTGSPRAIFTGTTLVNDPWFSSDGTRIAFEEDVPTDSTAGRLFVADADGSNVAEVTPKPISHLQNWDFSTDGRSVVVTAADSGLGSISVAASDGSGVQRLSLGTLSAGNATFRPGGSDILFIGTDPFGAQGLYLIGSDGNHLRTIVPTVVGENFFGDPVWSPDGSHVAFVLSDANKTHIHIVDPNGKQDRLLFSANMPVGQIFDAWPVWSPDGTKLVVQRGDGTTGHYAVARADGTGPVVDIQTPMGGNGANYQWAPDGSVILARPNDDPKRWQLWDPLAGTAKPAPVNAVSFPTWQRLAH